MESPEPSYQSLVFGDFLQHLRQRGFALGVDQYVSLQRLLQQSGGDFAPQRLKTLLCPLFARNQVQQEQFYRLFDEYFSIFRPATATARDFSPDAGADGPRLFPLSRRPRRLVYLAGIVSLVIAALFIFALRPKAPVSSGITGNSKEPTVADSDAGNVNSNTQVAENQKRQNEKDNLDENSQSNSPASRPLVWPIRFYQAHRSPIHWTLLFIPVVIFLAVEWRHRRNRRLVLQRQRGKKPPFVWPLRVNNSLPRIFADDRFYAAARALRRRQTSDHFRLDIQASIAATLRSRGFPRLRYRPTTAPPEYLILIERASLRDHRSRFFDELVTALQNEEVHIARYFFDRDPRICQNKIGTKFIRLETLKSRFPEHRLIIYGVGEALCDPVTGGLSPWTKIFEDWSNRAVLSPEPLENWGLREIALAGCFSVWPSGVKYLSLVVDGFESSVGNDVRSRVVAGGFNRNHTYVGHNEDIESLQQSLGGEVFQWICTTAIYPELHWDLTLLLGTLPSLAQNVITESNLSKLAGLAWFQQGAIPDEMRSQLIQKLDKQIESEARSAIIDLLEKLPPPRQSFAANVYQFNLAAQRWLFGRDRKRRRELVKLIKRMPPTEIVGEYTVVRSVEASTNSPLSLLLPTRLKTLVYRNSFPAFGLKTGARFALTILVVAIGIAFLRVMDRPKALTEDQMAPQQSTPPKEAPTNFTALASSSRNSEGVNTYYPSNIIDQNLATAWDENAPGPGIGEWVKCDFGREVILNSIKIYPGYFKGEYIWSINNRLAAATISFSDGSSKSVSFPDLMEPVNVPTGGVRTRWVKLVIDGVYAGKDDLDTPISEMEFSWTALVDPTPMSDGEPEILSGPPRGSKTPSVDTTPTPLVPSLPNSFSRDYYGTIGGTRLHLRLNKFGQRLTGTATTDSNFDTLVGTIDTDGNFRLEGRENSDRVTGLYRGRLNIDGTITGAYWTYPNGTGRTPIRVL